ncbi:sigma-70 family RNA polymerase sigma factor [Horticoccus luteus]|uniref:Sigma-70 family RNA polymerase sigma factor n=1 Tax=Horticoccus luteus TaxID=2862869 RepID=A0A8F9TVB7_9BACT|nr:sigma factor [Horticoccus luteus]QYM78257.1 sigma-70 family RNA polymerase sigma factor [Horticoccus luteus]
MTALPPRPDPSPQPRGEFASTQWSVVLAARGQPDQRRAALEQLCRQYWLPIYGYLRRRDHSPADAEDLTQGFFAHLLASDFLTRPDPERGRFRGYLIGALKQFVGHARTQANALKRGGGFAFVDLDHLEAEERFAAIDQPQLDPSAAYELSWAITLLGSALRRLEDEQTAAGRRAIFEVLKPFLHATPARGDFEHAATTLQTSRATVAVWLHRLHQRLGELVKLEVAATLENPADAAQELRHLLQVLHG